MKPARDHLSRTDTMLKRHHCSSVEFISHDVVELILERLPVKSLLKFTSVSKRWKSTIESQSFRQGQLVRRRLSRGPDVLFVPVTYPFAVDGVAETFAFGSSIAYTVRIPTTTMRGDICRTSCDGLVCLYNIYEAGTNVVVNPATGWHRNFPISTIQQFLLGKAAQRDFGSRIPFLGFGQDKFRGTYKPVWLYNSSDYGLENVTTCEVFDFSTNTWRYLLPASPYRIVESHGPVHFDGSLYWFTEGEEAKLLSFDLHTETFQVMAKAPFPHAPNRRDITMCVLDNSLCVSHKNWPIQVIWSLNPDSSGTWREMCEIDLTNITKTYKWFEGKPKFPLSPIAFVEKNKLLLKGRDHFEPVVIHDLDTKTCDILCKLTNPAGPVCYFDSFLSF